MHLAAQRAQFRAARGEKVAPIDQQFAGIRLDESQQHPRECGFSASGFADDGERFARGKFEVYIIHSYDAGARAAVGTRQAHGKRACRRGKRLPQIAGFEKRRARHLASSFRGTG